MSADDAPLAESNIVLREVNGMTVVLVPDSVGEDAEVTDDESRALETARRINTETKAAIARDLREISERSDGDTFDGGSALAGQRVQSTAEHA